ncbi:hypothetical protein MLD38_026619 [Melastoma candidum]|uniref:Uncharacterized protein n=1 Tax=Melastoma candidum TaxID=119954 RepID=A0ACB9P113_9MYRT|nr:hypothetical protein MLD38_026619 [Melastoma candidum]
MTQSGSTAGELKWGAALGLRQEERKGDEQESPQRACEPVHRRKHLPQHEMQVELKAAMTVEEAEERRLEAGPLRGQDLLGRYDLLLQLRLICSGDPAARLALNGDVDGCWRAWSLLVLGDFVTAVDECPLLEANAAAVTSSEVAASRAAVIHHQHRPR